MPWSWSPGGSVRRAAQLMGHARAALRSWRDRFLAGGRTGLADHHRLGRPPNLDTAARELGATVLPQSPLDYGSPVTTWTGADGPVLRGRHGYAVSPGTVNRTLHAMGYRSRRPRPDLSPRQDAEAVAAAQPVLAELQKRGSGRGGIPAYLP